MKYETTYLVFAVNNGPKSIVESLNSHGNDGWELKSMINVGGENLVAFLQRQTDVEKPKDKQQEKLKKLWSSDSEDE